MIEVVDYKWYSGGTGTVGFILTYDDITDLYCVYTGCCFPDSLDLNADVKHIQDFGAKVELPVALAMFHNRFDIERYKLR